MTALDRKEAEKVSNILLLEKLVACSVIFPVKSAYWWNGKIKKSNEYVIIAKTRKGIRNKIQKAVRKVHSYKIPCILFLPAEGNSEYVRWLNETTRSN